MWLRVCVCRRVSVVWLVALSCLVPCSVWLRSLFCPPPTSINIIRGRARRSRGGTTRTTRATSTSTAPTLTRKHAPPSLLTRGFPGARGSGGAGRRVALRGGLETCGSNSSIYRMIERPAGRPRLGHHVAGCEHTAPLRRWARPQVYHRRWCRLPRRRRPPAVAHFVPRGTWRTPHRRSASSGCCAGCTRERLGEVSCRCHTKVRLRCSARLRPLGVA